MGTFVFAKNVSKEFRETKQAFGCLLWAGGILKPNVTEEWLRDVFRSSLGLSHLHFCMFQACPSVMSELILCPVEIRKRFVQANARTRRQKNLRYP